MDFDPKVSPYKTSDQSSFAYVSARDRWPVILTGAIDDVHRAIGAVVDEEKRNQGKRIVEDLAKLKHELQHDRQLSPLVHDGGPDIEGYNAELEALGSPTWFNVPWLYAECYLYRRISTFFKLSTHWKSHDVFAKQKISTFKSSRPAVLELASKYHQIVIQLRKASSKSGNHAQENDPEAERLLFIEMCEICLWGNATDLSLLTSLTYEDIQKLQGSSARKESEKNIISNALPQAYAALKTAQKALPLGSERRIDIVLDNAGFEIFVDLILAGYLLTSGLATTIILHPKSIPWFVSDVIPADVASLFTALADPTTFYSKLSEDELAQGKPTPAPLSDKEIDDLQFLFQDFSGFLEEGKLIQRPSPFWTHAGSFWRMPHTAPSVFADLKESELVIFKGDLNYRKLTGDVEWDPTEDFSKTLGPLGLGGAAAKGGKSSGLRVLALRTCKADVVVGLEAGVDERLRGMEGGGGGIEEGGSGSRKGPRKWAWSGKWAVVQFSDGKGEETK